MKQKRWTLIIMSSFLHGFLFCAVQTKRKFVYRTGHFDMKTMIVDDRRCLVLAERFVSGTEYRLIIFGQAKYAIFYHKALKIWLTSILQPEEISWQ